MQRGVNFIIKPLKSACLVVWSDKQTTRIILFLAAVQVLGIMTGLLFPHGRNYVTESVFSKLLAWDGRGYFSIGQNGYTWNQAYCTLHFCTLAFFPLQGVIDKVFLLIFGVGGAVVATVLTSWAFGVASIFCFARLARMVMGQGAGSAIFLYALYPGSLFYVMGYPTGLMLLAVILALHNALLEKWWRSAVWIGVGGAAGASVIFVGFAIGVYYLFDQFRRKVSLQTGARVLGWAALALSGLLLFVLYQYVFFGDATAFMTAQIPWTGSVTDIMKIRRLVSFYWYVVYYLQSVNLYKAAYQTLLLQHGNEVLVMQNQALHISDFIEMLIESVLNLGFFVLAWVGLALCGFFTVGKKAKILICTSGLCALLGYEWFVFASDWAMQSTIRLIFPVIAMFIGLGGLCHKFKPLEYALFPLFTVVSFLQVAFVVSGFIVT